MSLQEIKQTAFAKWLLSVPESAAENHILQCLLQPKGQEENLAWDLFDALNGRERFVSTGNHQMLREMLAALKAA